MTKQIDKHFDDKIWHFTKAFGEIMKCSVKLMSIPPNLADKFNLKIWKDFEKVASETLELCKFLKLEMNEKL